MMWRWRNPVHLRAAGEMRRESGAAQRCLPIEVAAAAVALAVIDGALMVIALVQLFRIHFRNQQLGWTRQKLFHLMIGLSNLGYFGWFISTLVAACKGWRCWSRGCGFIIMGFPNILSLATFLLLLSFWIDLCHQTSDEEEEELGYNEVLLENSKNNGGSLNVDSRRTCCFPRSIHIGSRQRIVILVIVLTFVSMIVFAILMWTGSGRNPINSSLLYKVSIDIFSVAVLLLGGALACYGAVLFSKMRKVRSEMVSTEMWKVASLAAVSVTCFTSSSVLALVTNVPLQLLSCWQSADSDYIRSSVLLVLYYLIGSTVPSGFILWIMREMPPRFWPDSRRITRPVAVSYIRERINQEPQWRANITSSQNKGLKASPI